MALTPDSLDAALEGLELDHRPEDPWRVEGRDKLMLHIRFRGLTILALVALAAGAILLFVGAEAGRVENFLPFQGPFPNAGHDVGGSFRLSRGGRFMLEVVAPATSAERAMLHREQPPVMCNVDVMIVEPSGVRVSQKITRLHNGGWTKYVNLYMPDEVVDLPTRGEYKLRIVSREPVDVFLQRGALVRLTRFEPAGPEMFAGVCKAFGYACLGVAFIATLMLLKRRAA